MGFSDKLEAKYTKCPTVRLSEYDLKAFMSKAVCAGKKLGITVETSPMIHCSIAGAGSVSMGRHPETFNLVFELPQFDWDLIQKFRVALMKIDKDNIAVRDGIGYAYGSVTCNFCLEYFPEAQRIWEEGRAKVRQTDFEAKIQAEINKAKVLGGQK